jgi:hypothetical protein
LLNALVFGSQVSLLPACMGTVLWALSVVYLTLLLVEQCVSLFEHRTAVSKKMNRLNSSENWPWIKGIGGRVEGQAAFVNASVL